MRDLISVTGAAASKVGKDPCFRTRNRVCNGVDIAAIGSGKGHPATLQVSDLRTCFVSWQVRKTRLEHSLCRGIADMRQGCATSQADEPHCMAWIVDGDSPLEMPGKDQLRDDVFLLSDLPNLMIKCIHDVY